ncbi:cytochrome c biogenesis protein CcsA [Flavobacterium sp. MAH-1]|uniref:Cytochrome c biogenesis protein CcsA n=1 Tax=Flavobacterium agri TaxID=2743471 RepID=A0A7Y8XZV9_9FLAO|nr:cytochrome c biogenesis protein CcsA [Flavobacterium agri]NUY79792.1 cytochrome c biogenesis protein CcsA [Flavobacterium agri]NYA69817.1 cytochrome c biogenesis protein CcsA [Flavobacterium agri]
MGKKLLSALFSTRLMAILFIVFAAAMAAGTFIENDYNTDTARILVYNAWWFEAIMLLFMVNFIGNIKRYNLLQREKWPTLVLHLAFILIIFGAFVTRYISYEGMMPIREGASENKIYSERPHLAVLVDGQYKGQLRRRMFEKSLLLSPVTDNGFTMSEKFADTPFTITYEKYIMGATESIKPNGGGHTYLKLVEAGDGGRHEHYLKEGEVQNIHNLLFALNKFTKGAININTKGGAVTVQMPFDGQFMRMADRMQGKVTKDSLQPLMFRSLYNVGAAQFVFPEAPIKGFLTYKSNGDFKDKKSQDALIVSVKSGSMTREVTLLGSKGRVGEPQMFTLGKLDFTLSFGSKTYDLPFKIHLNDFIASKYPGSEKSYSAYESRVTVEDGKDKFDTRIYMNHVLDHKGYRFFQASFDPDEKGTVLSVNHDFWGTWITYVGYFLLFAGMLAILFTKGSRMGELRRKLKSVQKKKTKIATILLLFLGLSGHAQQDPHAGHAHEAEVSKPMMPSLKQIDSLISKYKVKEEHAAKFGRLVIQDEGGRMKPVNTFSSELLRKVSKKDSYNGMNSDQVFLSMTQFPTAWFEVPFIYLKSGNDSIRKIIGIKPEAKYAKFIDFFDNQGNYKLSPYLDEAYRAALPSQFQKDFIEADRKVNLLNSALGGSILRIFPIPNEENNKWVSYLQLEQAGLKGIDSTFTRQIIPIYLMSLKTATETGNYKEADFYLNGINKFQHRYGSKVMPSDDKINSEILYNKYDVFKRLFYLYMTVGVLMLLFAIANIFVRKKFMDYIIYFFHGLIVLLFLFHTLGLIARWYISGHAPWSDAYESMIYVGWATMLFTLIFSKKSPLTVASGTFVASMILMIAHWNWMDPAIANLQPVLNSYWLMIHVAVIVASYGPFTLGMVLGVVSLLLMIFVNKDNRQRMELHIREITYINEMALTIGLVMLTIGNFLGGQWANESWGRYWGWDPKETWALISIMIYAFVIHMRLVPGMRSKWIFNVASVFAFYSIMMTYFGVNFYLSGLHSYASGDKVVTPTFVYVSVAIAIVLSVAAWFGHKRMERK